MIQVGGGGKSVPQTGRTSRSEGVKPNGGVFLRAIVVELEPGDREYPFSVPTVASMRRLDTGSPVTFLAGGNGTGKSTVLEAIAHAAGSIPVHGEDERSREVMRLVGPLADRMRLQWSHKTRRGFFLRAEDFLDYKRHLLRSMGQLQDISARFHEELTGYGRRLAVGAARKEQMALTSRYGEDPDAMSHGESFLHFFQARFSGPGLYLLDEPDTALATQSVLGLLAMIKRQVEAGAQFIIATHNPVLLALQGASIISFDRTPPARVDYDELEQVALMRDFLNHPAAYLRRL